jgi:hypothetical protein
MSIASLSELQGLETIRPEEELPPFGEANNDNKSKSVRQILSKGIKRILSLEAFT